LLKLPSVLIFKARLLNEVGFFTSEIPSCPMRRMVELPWGGLNVSGWPIYLETSI
jgi:hypothetical protein